jgi:hypothetical protein
MFLRFRDACRSHLEDLWNVRPKIRNKASWPLTDVPAASACAISEANDVEFRVLQEYEHHVCRWVFATILPSELFLCKPSCKGRNSFIRCEAFPVLRQRLKCSFFPLMVGHDLYIFTSPLNPLPTAWFGDYLCRRSTSELLYRAVRASSFARLSSSICLASLRNEIMR